MYYSKLQQLKNRGAPLLGLAKSIYQKLLIVMPEDVSLRASTDFDLNAVIIWVNLR